jgi:hypothetical protein
MDKKLMRKMAIALDFTSVIPEITNTALSMNPGIGDLKALRMHYN